MSIRNILSRAIIGVGGVLMIGTWIAGFMLHLYTILFAYKVSGFISAALALAMPFIAQIYWVFSAWRHTGDFINGFSFYVFAYIAYFLFSMFVLLVGSAIEKSEK